MGIGIKSISSAFHLSRNTVRKYVRKYQESGLTMEQMLSMSEDKLQDLFLDSKNQKPFERIMVMEYELAFIGKIKMTVGIRRRTKEKVQYCITAIRNI